jgi:predicted N-acetyltransferase YhbS
MIRIETWGAQELTEAVRVLNAASRFDQFPLDHVREAVFEDPDFAPELLFAARSGDDLVGVASAVSRRSRKEPDARPIGYVKLLAVAPSWEGQGIGGNLLSTVERALGATGARTVRIFGDGPNYLRPGVDFRLTRLVCFFLRRGYASRHDAVNMEVDLRRQTFDTAADERRLADEGFDIRRLARADGDAFAGYLGETWGWGWQSEACRTLKRDPITTHVALRNGQIVGFASCNASGPGQFGPMGTDATLRRHGIGGILLKRCLADLRAQGYPTADIQWVGPIAFYARQVGATLSRLFWQFERGLSAED